MFGLIYWLRFMRDREFFLDEILPHMPGMEGF